MALLISLPVNAAVIAALATFFAAAGMSSNPGIELATPLTTVPNAETTNASSGFCPVAAAFTKLLAPFAIPVFTLSGRLTSPSAVLIAPDMVDPT